MEGPSRDYGIELTAVPKSRAPTYSTPTNFWDGLSNDNEFLINRDNKKGLNADDVSLRPVSLAPTSQSNRERRKKLQGWRFGVTCAAWTAFSVLLLNLILTIVAISKFGSNGGVGTAYEGSCEVVNSWTTWLHILINALSSILLSASNYTMQCLCSPTRKEIDEAHAKGDWLDIGVASVRNIWRIRWTRRLLWWGLALSSIPIHLLYNSAIFKSLGTNEYTAAVVNTDFLDGGAFNNRYNEWPNHYNSTISSDAYSQLQSMQSSFQNNLHNSSAVANLSNSDCIAAYGTSFVAAYNHVLIITSERRNTTNDTVFWEQQTEYDPQSGGYPSYFWICNDLSVSSYQESCDIPTARKNATNWTVNGAKIEYCLAAITPPHCKLQFSVQILVTVILMNAAKSLCMFMTLYRQRESTLVTIGDAVSSFLERPDELTKGRCLMAKVDVEEGPLRWRLRTHKQESLDTNAVIRRFFGQAPPEPPNLKPPAVTYYAPLRRRWFAGASIKRWVITMGLCLVALITGASLLGAGASNIGQYLGTGSSVFDLGFGAVDSRALLSVGLPQDGAGGLVTAVLLANLPQAVVSFLYLTYNGLLTSMLLCHEYSKYAMDGRRKPLRVTTSHGQQRSTYYLNLPYTYSIPLLIASGTLHWLISQSIFLARLNVYGGQGSDQAEYSEIG
ncbi:hypothetical protein LTR78_010305 [Recurvomyces mirabilis]|uniref:DUF6536 domain-containing protein n=1 Tax=Recurvomyces mirabilis TaxID=574656 RepID=A0AAE0WGZ1_9PEZI|nr:hypothetical protein LTR78_010305 [Recurvomyces mirabilis]KAK5149625.1 hypothetical protein LTS14_010756 [Recurvomyces mirabilis]